MRETALRIGAEVLEAMLNVDQHAPAPSITRPDGTVVPYAGKREKTFVTVLGDIALKRAYYTDGNGSGYFPQDELLGFDTDSLSGGIKRMIGHTASIVSFQESSSLIKNLAAIESAATADLDETLSDFAQRVERELRRRA